MITRIEVDGFKSLRDFVVDLEPFTVFVGPNSAGKSNILEALALLSRLASMPINEAFKRGRGRVADQFTRHGAEAAKSIRFAVDFLSYGKYPPPKPREPGKDAFQSRFRYELSVERKPTRSGVEQLVARDERLKAMRREDDTWIAQHPEFADLAGYLNAGEDYFITLKDDRSLKQRIVTLPAHWPEEKQVSPNQTAFSQSINSGHRLVWRDLAECHVLHMDRVRLGEPSERTDAGDLATDASNLPTVLADLPEQILGEIRADLVSLVPGIASFDIVAEGDTFRIEFELSGGDRLPARLVSDGTLRLLALLTSLKMEPRPCVIGIEEPENGIYPGRQRALLNLLREASERRCDDEELSVLLGDYQRRYNVVGFEVNQLPTQILLTSHSPVVLSALSSRPRHLRFVDMIRRNGERITRACIVGRSTGPATSRQMISPEEINKILDAALGEEAG